MDAFTLLGVKPGDSEADLARAYRRAMFDAHPDRGGSDERARALSKAYDALKAQIVDGRLVQELPPVARVIHQGVVVRFVIVRHGGPNWSISHDTTTSSTGPW